MGDFFSKKKIVISNLALSKTKTLMNACPHEKHFEIYFLQIYINHNYRRYVIDAKLLQ